MAVDIEIPLSDIEEEAEKPSRTYCLDLDKGRIIGMVDGIDAVKQAVEKALSTRRFYCLIYDSDYGCDATNAVHDKI
ncbi:MAG: DUF2634 domain-containing protein [Oscillospiraceae bacterium]|nr:DUF2634 domain-containing protein [Oscillospiraceae bacterium]